jgi:hypothetical protein
MLYVEETNEILKPLEDDEVETKIFFFFVFLCWMFKIFVYFSIDHNKHGFCKF